MAIDLEEALGFTKEGEAEAKLNQQLATNSASDAASDELAVEHFVNTNAKELAKTSLNFLAGLAIPTVFTFLFPRVLLTVWSLLTTAAQDIPKNPKIALGIPRGHAKTTLLKLFVIYCIFFTKLKFILIICDTGPKAENFLADVEDMLNEPNIIAVFGDWKQSCETNRNELKKFAYNGRPVILAALGAGGSIRGLNIKNERPELMLFDDIQTAECAESEVESDKLLRWMIGTAMKARSPRGCLFAFAGNMYRTPKSILKKLKSNPGWIKFISGAILADGSVLWPELRSMESLIEELNDNIAMGHPEIFFSEVMNDTDSGINTKVDFSKIREWPWSDFDNPQGKFIIVDPSGNKKGSDLVGIGYFEIFDEYPGLREVVEEALSPGDTIRKALLLALKYNCKVIAVEATAYQATLIYWFEQITMQLGLTGFQCVEIHSNYASKNARIVDMLKDLTSAKLFLHNSTRSRVLHQITNWNPLKRDNIDNVLDLLGHAHKVVELYGPICATEANLEMATSYETVSEGAWAF